MNKKYICPICGYDGLEFEPVESYEICPCCGYEFGTCDYFDNSNYPVDVGEKFNYEESENFYAYVRELWIKHRCEWWSDSDQKPKNWDPLKQLRNLNLSQEQIERCVTKKSKLKNKYNTIFKIVRQKLNKLDPMGFDPGETCPIDEYNQEVEMILPALRSAKNEHELAQTMASIFKSQFGQEFSAEMFDVCAKNILGKTKNLLK